LHSLHRQRAGGSALRVVGPPCAACMAPIQHQAPAMSSLAASKHLAADADRQGVGPHEHAMMPLNVLQAGRAGGVVRVQALVGDLRRRRAAPRGVRRAGAQAAAPRRQSLRADQPPTLMSLTSMPLKPASSSRTGTRRRASPVGDRTSAPRSAMCEHAMRLRSPLCVRIGRRVGMWGVWTRAQ